MAGIDSRSSQKTSSTDVLDVRRYQNCGEALVQPFHLELNCEMDVVILPLTRGGLLGKGLYSHLEREVDGREVQ